MAENAKGIIWSHGGVNYLICNGFSDKKTYIVSGANAVSAKYPIDYIGYYDSNKSTRYAKLVQKKKRYRKVGSGNWEEEQLLGIYEDLLTQDRNGLAPFDEDMDLEEVYIKIISGTGKDMVWTISSTDTGITGIKYGDYIAFVDSEGIKHYGKLNSDGTVTMICDVYDTTTDGKTNNTVNDRTSGKELIDTGSGTYTESQDSLYVRYKDILEMPRYNNYAPYTKGMKLEEVDIEVDGTGTDLKYRVL